MERSGANGDDGASAATSIGDLSSDWSVGSASLYRSADRPGDQSRFGGSISTTVLRTALDHAAETVRETTAEHDGYAVPLHDADGDAVTDEYVLWRPDADQFGWYDEGFGIDGTVRFVGVDTAAATTIGDRLRRWHPDERDAEAAVEQDDYERESERPNDSGAPAEADESAVELPPSTVEPTTALDETAVEDVVEDLLGFVASEREAERAANRAHLREAGVEALVADGVATGPFVSLGRANRPDDLGEFRLQLAEGGDDGGRDPARGRDGDGMRDVYPNSVFLAHALDGDDEAFPFAVRATRVDGPVLTVKPAQSCDLALGVVEDRLSDRDREFWLAPLSNPVPYERRTEAIERVVADDAKRGLLAGSRPVHFAADPLSTPSVPLELNAYQRRALKWAVDAEDVVCIHGPPGTGKTRALTAFVLHAASHGQSVLVAAHSNQAVDNLLVGDSTLADPEPETLHAFAAGADGEPDNGDRDADDDRALRVARVGRNSTNDVVDRHYATASVATADVVAATTSGAATFDADAFDVAVVDEATQASRAATAIALDRAEKLVLAGDHRQLPPYATREGANGALDPESDGEGGRTRTSLFESLLDRYGDDVSVLLGRQYRMHEAIAEFPNEAFYDGDLETAAAVRDRTIDGLDPLVGVDVRGGDRQAAGEHSYANPAEAEVVVEEVRRLVEHGVAPEDVGVIATYRGQVDLLCSLLGDADIEGVGRTTVDTVDSFQGGEREAVVVSFVRSNDAARSGFLEVPDEGPRRLNVALTRARKRLVLVGDWATLSTVGPNRTPECSCASVYAALRDRLERDDRMRSRR
ncbi:AAA family ATPase [Halorubellus sp. JP-L1]|uniref:AAA domain-containing protein n=1 Tax=Halorubellus sp. JP-L1 TaxID=2715753 RepID=UPI00140910D0|nr:AAA domain-containing protein [Halorubellus sp. JP-L1]NHN43052.1 AAA family ATPase [Halorubellus sp. JP-L1]